MIVKKLAVPLINGKILQQAEHCYIATAAISEDGFDFINSRLPPKCKMDIVTGLDEPTSPNVLRRIWRNYQGRVTLNIYTRNVLHANVYIFDLPYRQSVAFVGSGTFSLEGIKDHEEIFFRISDQKEIESLKSWFTGYFEFAEPISETLIQEYNILYPDWRLRLTRTADEKKQFIALNTSGFNWDAIKFKTLYFKKEDYLAFTNTKAPFDTPELLAERTAVQTKLLQLHETLKKHAATLKLYADESQPAGSLNPAAHEGQKLRSLALTYGRNERGREAVAPGTAVADVMHIETGITQSTVYVRLSPGKAGGGREDRLYVEKQMHYPEYRTILFQLLKDLGAEYILEVAGEKRAANSFANEDALWQYTKMDLWQHYPFTITKNFAPADPAINNDNIVNTLSRELDRLITIYRHLQAQP
jgi:hypothetical protein